jgi:hypothetical protein
MEVDYISLSQHTGGFIFELDLFKETKDVTKALSEL